MTLETILVTGAKVLASGAVAFIVAVVTVEIADRAVTAAKCGGWPWKWR